MTSMIFISGNSYFIYSLNIIFSQTHCLVSYGQIEAPLLMVLFDNFFSLLYFAVLEPNEPTYIFGNNAFTMS